MVRARAKEVRLSSKHQVVIPRESREVLGLKPGDRLLVVTLGEQVIVLRKPVRHADATAGRACIRSATPSSSGGPGVETTG